MTDQNITETQSKKSGTGTWSRVIRLIEAHPDVKQVRLNINDHSVTVGFYETPSEQARNQIKAEVRAQLSGQWDMSIMPDDKSATIHRISSIFTSRNFIDRIPPDKPPVIWKRNSVAEVVESSVSTCRATRLPRHVEVTEALLFAVKRERSNRCLR